MFARPDEVFRMLQLLNRDSRRTARQEKDFKGVLVRPSYEMDMTKGELELLAKIVDKRLRGKLSYGKFDIS